MKRALVIGGAAAAVAATSSYFLYRRYRAETPGDLPQEPEPEPNSTPGPMSPNVEPPPETPPVPTDETPETARVGVWDNVLPLPTAADVSGDLETNWGSTPTIYRPLFQLMEEASGIPGSARIYSVISYQEARYVPSAQNGDGDTQRDKNERIYSARAWKTMQKFKYDATNTPHGEEASQFGSGGMFGALAPYFLAIGAVSLGKSKAPLLRSRPQIIFLPRIAGFHAVVFLWRLHKQYTIDDILDIKVGWGSPSLLVGESRGGKTFTKIRDGFTAAFDKVGIDRSKLPDKLDMSGFPGVMPVFDKIVKTLPTWAG